MLKLQDCCRTHAGLFDVLEAQIKNLKAAIEEAKKGIMMSMKDAKEGYSESHKAIWQTVNYKAQPEKLVPAKDAYTSRRFSIKELPKKD